MIEKIFITGGTGFLGANLVRKLCSSGKDVTILVHGKKDHPFLKGLKIKRKIGNVRDYNSVLKSMKGCNYVYHLAAILAPNVRGKNDMFDVNIIGTENVMRAALENKIRKIVHASSTSVFGYSKKKKQRINEKSEYQTEKDQNSYGYSKKLAEEKVLDYVAKGLNATIIHPCSIVGEGEETPLFLTLVKSISKGRIKFVFPGGTSFVDVGDVVRGLILAMEHGKKGQRYILSSHYMELIEQFNAIAEELKKPPIRIRLPKISYYPALMIAKIMEKTIKNPLITVEALKHAYGYRNFDSSKAKKELGWKPKVSYQESVSKAIEYYKKHKSF